MLKLNDGRNELWQWDTGRKLTVDAECSQVHFSNKVFGRSIDVDVVGGVASIPDILLQTDKDLTAWAFVGTAENGYTKISKVFKVNKRNKPADYVFTEQDKTTLGEILNRIEDLEKRPGADISKEDIQDAVNEYLDNNPVSVNETDPTVPNWAKQPNPPKQPDALPNPHKLTFSGAVSAKYDGSKAVEVVIPHGGDEWNYEYLFEASEDVASVEFDFVDSDGNPVSLRRIEVVQHLLSTKASGADTSLKVLREDGAIIYASVANNFANNDGNWLSAVALAEIIGRTVYALGNKAIGSSASYSGGFSKQGVVYPVNAWGDRWAESLARPVAIIGIKVPGAIGAKSQLYICGVRA